MKKEDPYQLNRQEWLEEAFKDAEEAKEYQQDPHQFKLDKAHELQTIKNQEYERQQANQKAAQEDKAAKRETERREIEDLKEKLRQQNAEN